MNTEKLIEKVLETRMDSQTDLSSKVAREQLAAQIAAAVQVKGATDTRILDSVYDKLKNPWPPISKDLTDFIEEEWQTADYLARFQEAGVGVQGEIGVKAHYDGCGFDDGIDPREPS